MIFRLSKALTNSFVICYVFFFVATAKVQAELKSETIVEANSAQWQQTLKAATGQSVYFYAWGGCPANSHY
jgi:ABC-type uncharacterized transport system YnjBCD substrate-binding protein